MWDKVGFRDLTSFLNQLGPRKFSSRLHSALKSRLGLFFSLTKFLGKFTDHQPMFGAPKKKIETNFIEIYFNLNCRTFFLFSTKGKVDNNF